ncbi:OmpA family protein [Fulvivirgaceae bacterium PWU5]|uniref:OmpA family protein n=1 Tax=Dawidia cretensis TaxID=2782350 RepID=A0AAP2DUC4_9BACT|nr:OmpA family protein [Dawidia cretensis]MBT1707391.1 OmpA family protein [Dawidia cretensis]
MRHLIIVLLLCGIWSVSLAQALKDFDKRFSNKVNRKIDQKVDRNIDKVLNKADQRTDKPIDDVLTPKPDGKKAVEKKESAEGTQQENNEDIKLHAAGDFDFVPGSELIFADNFEKDAVGDFPASWNTSGSGEVLILSGMPGKWLSIPHNTLTLPEKLPALPENFTVEFNLIYPGDNRPPITFGFTDSKNPVKENIQYKKLFYFRIQHTQDLIGSTDRFYSGGENNQSYAFKSLAGKVMRVSISVNKTRIRLYLNRDKVFDLPRAFEPFTLRNNFFLKSAAVTSKPQPFYIADVRIAAAGTDARSGILKEFMDKGSVSTNAIQFDFNSDKITPSSYQIIDEFGEALKRSDDWRINIIGHTDNIGKDSYNQQLSAKRAAAVKAYLVSKYDIDTDRIQTEGKGAAISLKPNDTAEGRAANRRVEFVRLTIQK